MKKKNLHLGLFISMFFLSCKKEVECGFTMAYLNGKSFSISKVDSISKGVKYDITSRYLSNPCNNRTIHFQETTVSISYAAGCTNVTEYNNCATLTENNINYFVNYGVNPYKTEVLDFNCQSFRGLDIDSIYFTFQSK